MNAPDLQPFVEQIERDVRQLAALVAPGYPWDTEEQRAEAAAAQERAGQPKRRPHYVPAEVWLGVEIGRWPIQTFPSRDMAARWAAEGKPDTVFEYGDRRRIFRVEIPDGVDVLASETVPSSTRLKPVSY